VGRDILMVSYGSILVSAHTTLLLSMITGTGNCRRWEVSEVLYSVLFSNQPTTGLS
jgi:hypothetical protein